jgi:peroxin-12
MRRSLLRISWATLDYSHVLLLLSIAGYKFLEWIYSEEGTAKMRSVAIDVPIPPPPVPPQFSGSALAVTADPRLCPLCRRQRTNPAISISGYVFCYPCIYHYVEEEGECPLTKIKCDVDSISKIYEDEVSITTKG